MSNFIYCNAECRYPECRHAECHYAKCRGAFMYTFCISKFLLKATLSQKVYKCNEKI